MLFCYIRNVNYIKSFINQIKPIQWNSLSLFARLHFLVSILSELLVSVTLFLDQPTFNNGDQLVTETTSNVGKGSSEPSSLVNPAILNAGGKLWPFFLVISLTTSVWDKKWDIFLVKSMILSAGSNMLQISLVTIPIWNAGKP